MSSLQFLGATDSVTGSRFLVEHQGEQVLVDCGLFQGPKELRLRNWAPFPADLNRLEKVVFTHAHLDHTGYFPRLVKEGFRGTAFASPATVDLCGILWPDSGHLQEEDARFANKKGFSKHDPALPLYTEVEGIEAASFLASVPYEQWQELTSGLAFSLRPAGHIFGSSFIRLKLDGAGKACTVLFSGDLGRYDQPITPDPSEVEETDYLLVESTYGDRLHPDADPRIELAEIINRTAQRGGIVLIPSFAVGRTQELMYILRELEDAGKIPQLPVYLDSPMAIDATKILLKHPEEHDLEMTAMNRAGLDPLNSRQVSYVRTRELSQALNDQHHHRFQRDGHGRARAAPSGSAAPGSPSHRALRGIPGGRHPRPGTAGGGQGN